jgi:hypothetical protein
MRPRIFFAMNWSSVNKEPQSGGPKILQQHVRILNEHGFDARIVLAERRMKWLSGLGSRPADHTMMQPDFERTVSDRDFVVLPAVRAAATGTVRGAKKVLFVQNGSLLFTSLDLQGAGPYPWHSPGLHGIICLSKYDQHLLGLLGPTCPVYHVHSSVDADRFPLVPWEQKENLIVTAPLLPYKNPWHTAGVCHLVLSRSDAGIGVTRRPTVKTIQGIPPTEVPALLGKAKVLVFLSTSEGLGLLPAEALLSGTVVVCYRGQAYQEFMPEEYMHAVGDFDSIIRTVEQVLEGDLDGRWRETIARGRKAAERYSRAAQADSVVQIWNTIVGA